MQVSVAAKLAAAAIAVLMAIAFGWSMYHKGEVAGAASVQQKWDRQTAAVDSKTAEVVQQAASDALGNYRQAGASVQQADQHKAQSNAVRADLTKRVQEHAENAKGNGAVTDCVRGSDSNGSIDADGLRIWNDANAAARGAATVAASDHPGSATSAVRYDGSSPGE